MASKYLFPAVLIAALVGLVLALLLGEVAWLSGLADFLKALFLSALKLIVAPLIFFSLISGILRLGDAGELGRIGTATIGYYLGTTSIAIVLGLIAVFVIHPWTAMPALDALQTAESQPSLLTDTDSSLLALLSGVVQEVVVNPFQALAELNILAIVLNALVIGVAMLFVVPRESAIRDAVNTITEVFYKLTSWVIWVVPLGVLGIVFRITLDSDVSLILQLLSFSLLVIAITLLHGLVVLPALAYWLARADLRTYFRAAAKPLLVAFSTSSSVATLPVTLRAAQELEVSPSTSSFVIPFGATANMDGSALFEGIAAVFIAYLFGVDLNTLSIVAIFFAAMMASIGAPGIPSGSMAGMQMVLLAVGLPLEGIAILLIVERPLDMIRTACNVQGDLIGSLVVDRLVKPQTMEQSELRG